MDGYTGKILRLNLTERNISTIDTQKYECWGGGHGMGSALFWDLVSDKTISAFDPRNVITLMTSPLSGTMALGAAGRTEVQGIGPQSFPIEWFTRSNFGGRFSAMLKYAGWDGVVIEGAADSPVWIDIRDEKIEIKDARSLWGLDTWETQQRLWQAVMQSEEYLKLNRSVMRKKDGDQGLKPAVLTIGQAGENLSRVACLIHDAGHAAGQGGFGGVWGGKKLKAISVLGTGSVAIADPNALMETRLWVKQNYCFDIDDDSKADEINDTVVPGGMSNPGLPPIYWQRPKDSRPSACIGCPKGCSCRTKSGKGNESNCEATVFYSRWDLHRHSGLFMRSIISLFEGLGQTGFSFFFGLKYGKQSDAAFSASDLLQKYGLNAFEIFGGLSYLIKLKNLEVLGPGKEINCDLSFKKLGELEFVEKLLRMIVYRQGIGDDMAEGFVRAAKRWGRLEEDFRTGLLDYPHWGLPDHYDPRTEVEWGYGSIMGDRDINEHGFNGYLYWVPGLSKWSGKKPPISAEEMTRIVSEKLMPYEGDQRMLDYSTQNIYSERMAKLVAWHRHYSRFWKQSALYCDFLFPDFVNPCAPDNRGITGEGEQRFFNAITGHNLSFLDGMELGRKIWNLDNAIWTLQGRHRDIVHFAEYIYTVPSPGYPLDGKMTAYYMPGIKKGKWEYIPLNGRHIDREKFEGWKTKYYKLEGWDPRTGWPLRTTLKALGLSYVADELERKGRLGRDSDKGSLKRFVGAGYKEPISSEMPPPA